MLLVSDVQNRQLWTVDVECTNGQELKIMDYFNQLFGTKRAKSTNEDYNFNFSDDSDNFDNKDDSDSDDSASASDRDNGTRQTASSTYLQHCKILQGRLSQERCYDLRLKQDCHGTSSQELSKGNPQ